MIYRLLVIFRKELISRKLLFAIIIDISSFSVITDTDILLQYYFGIIKIIEGGTDYEKLIGILLLSLSIITLIACSKSNYQSLDGWVLLDLKWKKRVRGVYTIKEIMLPLSMEKRQLPLWQYDRINWTKYCRLNEGYSFKDEGHFSVDINLEFKHELLS